MRPSRVVGVIGQGYVGLELSVSLAKAGLSTIGFDENLDRVGEISRGHSPVENVSDSDLKEMLKNSHYAIYSDFSRLSECNVIVICVPTPLDENHEPDLKMLEAGVDSISRHVSPETLIINESTSFPGTLRQLVVERIEKARPELFGGLRFGVAPERVSPGSVISLRDVPRVVSGIDSISGKLTLDFYKQFCKEVHLVESPEVAEAAKLLENSFRQVNISFINEFNLICRKLGIDTREVIRAADTKPYGFMRFDPSPGIGGHCIPVDPHYFQYASKKLGLESKFIALATEINIQHGNKLLDLILKEVKKSDPRVLILGVAYKQGVSDTRESPALGIANALSSKNLEFGWFDPLIKTWQGTSQASLKDPWDVALVVTAQEGLPLEDLIRRGVSVFDFTGHFQEYDKVIQV